jgi:hypothetical protein
MTSTMDSPILGLSKGVPWAIVGEESSVAPTDVTRVLAMGVGVRNAEAVASSERESRKSISDQSHTDV